MSYDLSIKNRANDEYVCSNDAVEINEILYIKNDKKLSDLFLHRSFTHTYRVTQEEYDERTLDNIALNKPALVIIDIGFKSLPMLSIIPKIRAIYSGPLLVLTSINSEKEHISAFNLGVDEYLVKPISEEILTVRINALIKRYSQQSFSDERTQIQCGNLVLYPDAYKCELAGENIPLTRFEFKLLRLLLNNIGMIMSRDNIYRKLLGRDYNGSERTVDVRVSQLREKLIKNNEPQVKVETVWGQGYMLSAVN